MKILYGVQGTGNGHISRANAMAKALERYPDVEVTWLYSGRRREELFGVADNFLWRRGMTFATHDGRVSYARTALTNNFIRFVKDVRSLRLQDYDEVIVDYEPVSAWAARLRGVPTLGIGHQYAFEHAIPTQGDSAFSRTVMRYFAPASDGLGLHWHHFGQPILPPIVDLEGEQRSVIEANKVVVYLPFEDQAKVIRLLRNVVSHEFYVYGPGLEHADTCNVHTRPLARQGFKRDLVTAESVVCNAGFELISECLALGIRVLAKPLARQIEQLANAQALIELDYAKVIYELSTPAIYRWLTEGEYVHVNYPEVHNCLAKWLVQGRRESRDELARLLWDRVEVQRRRTPGIFGGPEPRAAATA